MARSREGGRDVARQRTAMIAAAGIWLVQAMPFAHSRSPTSSQSQTQSVAPSPSAAAEPAAPSAPAEPAATAPPSDAASSVSLKRIRSGLRRDSVIEVRPDIPVFRTEVEAHVITLKPYWKDDSTAVASYVRTAIPRGHHEYLQNVFGMTGNTGRLPFEAANNPVQFVTTPIFPILSTGFIDFFKERHAESEARKKAEAAAAKAKAAEAAAVAAREAAAPTPKPRETPPQ